MLKTLAESARAQRSKETFKYHTRRFIAVFWRRIHWKTWESYWSLPMCRDHAPNTILHWVKNHKFQMDKSVAVLEAKSQKKRVPGQKPVVGDKGKKAIISVKKQKRRRSYNGRVVGGPWACLIPQTQLDQHQIIWNTYQINLRIKREQASQLEKRRWQIQGAEM